MKKVLAKIAGVAALFALLRSVTPSDGGPLLCGFHWLTGRNCPLCGITRGLCALAKGEWSQALAYNALSPLAFLMLCALLWRGKAAGRLWSASAAAFALYGVWRIVVRA